MPNCFSCDWLIMGEVGVCLYLCDSYTWQLSLSLWFAWYSYGDFVCFCVCICVSLSFSLGKQVLSHICVCLYMCAYLYLCLPSHRFTYTCISMKPVLTHRTLSYLFPTVSDTLKKLILGYKMGQSLFPF